MTAGCHLVYYAVQLAGRSGSNKCVHLPQTPQGPHGDNPRLSDSHGRWQDSGRMNPMELQGSVRRPPPLARTTPSCTASWTVKEASPLDYCEACTRTSGRGNDPLGQYGNRVRPDISPASPLQQCAARALLVRDQRLVSAELDPELSPKPTLGSGVWLAIRVISPPSKGQETGNDFLKRWRAVPGRRDRVNDFRVAQ